VDSQKLEFDDLTVEVLDSLLDGAWPLPHMVEFLEKYGSENSEILDCLANLYAKQLVEFFEREHLFKSEGIVSIERGIAHSDILVLLRNKLREPKFEIDLTASGRREIEDFIQRLQR